MIDNKMAKHFPTILTFLMWPLLCVMYFILARREERIMIEKFGQEYMDYKKKVNMMIPLIGTKRKEI